MRFFFRGPPTDHARLGLPDHGRVGSQLGRTGRPGPVEQHPVRRVRDKVPLDVAVQAARVLQLQRGRQDTETPVRDQHHGEHQLHQPVRRG